MNPPFKTNIRLGLDNTQEIKCSCGHNIFQGCLMARKVSRLITGGPADTIISIPIFTCMKCGSIIEELIPPEMKEQSKEEESKFII